MRVLRVERTMKDASGVFRGNCLETGCVCQEYKLPVGSHDCLVCGHLPKKHRLVDACAQCEECGGFEEKGGITQQCYACGHSRDQHADRPVQDDVFPLRSSVRASDRGSAGSEPGQSPLISAMRAASRLSSADLRRAQRLSKLTGRKVSGTASRATDASENRHSASSDSETEFPVIHFSPHTPCEGETSRRTKKRAHASSSGQSGPKMKRASTAYVQRDVFMLREGSTYVPRRGRLLQELLAEDRLKKLTFQRSSTLTDFQHQVREAFSPLCISINAGDLTFVRVLNGHVEIPSAQPRSTSELLDLCGRGRVYVLPRSSTAGRAAAAGDAPGEQTITSDHEQSGEDTAKYLSHCSPVGHPEEEGGILSDSEDLDADQLSQTAAFYQCLYCPYELHNFDALREHEDICGARTEECSICHNPILRRLLHDHMEMHEADQVAALERAAEEQYHYAALLQEEPSEEDTFALIRFVFSDGWRVDRRFAAAHTVRDVRTFVATQPGGHFGDRLVVGQQRVSIPDHTALSESGGILSGRVLMHVEVESHVTAENSVDEEPRGEPNACARTDTAADRRQAEVPYVEIDADDCENTKSTASRRRDTLVAHRAKWLDEEKGRQSEQRVMIDRDNLLDDAIIAYSRRTFRPQAHFSVVFIGEDAVDGGGPKREFATLLFSSLSAALFEGRGRRLLPLYSVSLWKDSMFKTAGTMIAHCFLHSGVPFSAFSPVVWEYLMRGEAGVSCSDCLVKEDVVDISLYTLISEVRSVVHFCMQPSSIA